MDHLALHFAEESALRQIENCTDLAELKQLAASLMRGHFDSRAMICRLLEEGLPQRVSAAGSWPASAAPPAAPAEPA